MDYQKVYDKIILRAKNENRKKNNGVYYESHHIIPKCKPFLGSDKKENRVLLTAKEHYVCHKLLCKIYKDNESLRRALWYMMNQINNKHQKRDYKIGAREYELGKIEYNKFFKSEDNPIYKRTGDKHPMYGRRGVDNPNFGRKFPFRQKKGKENSNYGKPSIHIGRRHRKESIDKMKEGKLKVPKIYCEHCDRWFDPGNYIRHTKALLRRVIKKLKNQLALQTHD